MGVRGGNGPFNIFAETEISVEFFHLDPMRVVWHGNYIDFFEVGRRSLLEKIGCDYYTMEKAGYAFPIVKISAKFSGPLRFKDKARIKAILMEYENCLKIKYEIRNAETGLITTEGESTQMAININIMESCLASPAFLIEKVEALIGGKQ